MGSQTLRHSSFLSVWDITKIYMKIMVSSVMGPFIIGLLSVLSIVAQTPNDRPPAARAVSAATVMTVAQFQALSSKPADYRLSYGTQANQFGELRIPPGAGPYPVAVLIHGGCWKAEYAKLGELGPMADALKAKGIATWNIEYRRLAQAGSGWPGTYQDVGRGADFLRSIAAQNHLDLSRVIVVGHSAGGHLAMWVASRSRLPKGSLIYVSDPLIIRGVIDLAGTADMEAFIPVEEYGCGGAVVEQMLGGKPAEVPERYAQSSAVKMLPLGVPQTLFWGRKDDIAPISLGERYTRTAKQAGDPARLVSFPEIGHFEIASPFSTTWPAVEREILSLLTRRP